MWPFCNQVHPPSFDINFSSYLCVFVCMVTRAVHLELSSDLTTDKFLDAFKWYMARRGAPSIIYSDIAKTFVAAAKAVASESIEWKFIPPRAPHHGGLWEAAVKSAKPHLAHVTKGHSRTYEEYATLFNQIEAVLNSRPLCSHRDGEQEQVILTPGHFLTGDHLLVPSSSPLRLGQFAIDECNISRHFDPSGIQGTTITWTSFRFVRVGTLTNPTLKLVKSSQSRMKHWSTLETGDLDASRKSSQMPLAMFAPSKFELAARSTLDRLLN